MIRLKVTKRSTLLLAALLSSVLSTYPIRHARLEPTTWTVDDDGPAAFQTIQAAINVAQPGDLVVVGSGVYREHVALNKSVRVVGVGDKGTAVIDGEGTGTVVLATAYNATLEGFTVRNGLNGIIVSAAWNCTIKWNTVEDNENRGILTSNSRNCTLSRNHVSRTRSMYGLNVNSSRSILIEENAVSGNRFDGIGVFSSNNNIIRGNTVNDNQYFGIVVDLHSSNNMIYHNNFFNNGIQVGSSNPTNSWDSSGEGNYWSNYEGADANGDGVGEEPFVVDEETLQRDRFPLVRPFVNEVYLSVDTQPPLASFSYSPDVLFVNETASFDASESDDPVGKRAIASYIWDFGDGSTGAGLRVTHAYLTPGNVTVVLTAVDVAGNEGYVSVDIVVRLGDTKDERLPYATAIGVMVIGVVFGGIAIVLWFRWKKKRYQSTLT